MDSGSTRKYLFYALGEIALVVIGILIALQINNWNEKRKEKIQEEELFEQLYWELLRNHEYNQTLLQEGFNPQVSFIETLLREGQNLNIDSFMLAYRDHWPVKSYSFLNFIYGFTEFYDPGINYYQTAVNDGTISLIEDKEFVFGLERIYGERKEQIERIYIKETQVNRELQQYISKQYGTYFRNPMYGQNYSWDDSITKAFLHDILGDGEIRFYLFVKLTNLRSKKRILENNIILQSQELIDSYDKLNRRSSDK